MATDLMPSDAAAGRADRVRRLRISRKLFDRMVEAGVFPPQARIELLDGRLYQMPAMGNPHRSVINHAMAWLVKSIPPEWHVNCQTPIALDDYSEPEPDCAIVRGTTRDYRKRQPNPEEIAFVVEISDATLSYDRNRKLPSYAEAGISEYWILNLVAGAVEIHTDPRRGIGKDRGYYATCREYREADLVPLRLEGKKIAEIRVDDLLLLTEE